MTEKINTKQLKQVSTDTNLGTSDVLLPTQNAVKTYVDTTANNLQSEINDVKGRGRFLSIWNCATGLAETNPPESPYAYKSGDYFLVGTVDSTTNYKPNGSSYVTGVASTTVETSEVKSNDEYIYDGTSWKLLANSQREYAFSGIAGSPYDNTNLSNALDSKVDETSTANQVYGTDGNGDQTTYNLTDFGAVDDVKVNNVSVVTSKVANIDLTSYLKNIATATDAISVLGTANTSWTNGINIGKDSRINSTNGVAIGVDASADVNAVGIGRDTDAGVRGTAIGAYAKTSYDTGIAIGCWNSNMNNAVSSAKGAYQFGVGTNNTARTLNIGWYDDSVSPSTFRNYQLLDGNTGLIPDARISTNIARTTDIPTIDSAVVSGSPNPVSGGGVYTALQSKQNSLTAGSNITISGSTISAKDTTYTAGENITIESTGAEDYTLLEYIQSNGSQYIDTGVSGLDSGNWVIYVKWMQTAAPTTSYSYIAGAYNSESHNAYRIITKQMSASGYYVNGNSAAGNGSVLADNYAANVVHQGYIRNGSVTIDSTTYTTSTQGTAIPSGVHIFLLGSSNLGKTSCKLYESWATQNGVEKYHFYPAIRNSDSAVGMYDTVGQRFVAASAGTFAAGPVKSDGFIIKGKSWSLADLTDTVISNLSDGQSLIYDANTSKWKNVSASVSVSFSAITGSPEDNTALANALNAKSGCILRRW